MQFYTVTCDNMSVCAKPTRHTFSCIAIRGGVSRIYFLGFIVGGAQTDKIPQDIVGS